MCGYIVVVTAHDWAKNRRVAWAKGVNRHGMGLGAFRLRDARLKFDYSGRFGLVVTITFVYE